MWTQAPGFVGTWGPEKKSLLGCWRLPHVLEARRGGGGSRAAQALGAGPRTPARRDARPRRRGARRTGARGPGRPNKAGARGAGYSQQEAHVGRGVGCGRGGHEASGGTAAEVAAAREEEAKRKARRRGAPARRPQQLVRLRYFQRQAEGAEVGSARPESLSGEEKGKEAGQRPLARAGRTAAPRPRCCNPRRRLLGPPGSPRSRELSRELRTPAPPLGLRPPGPSGSGHLCSPGPRPASPPGPPGRWRPVSAGLVGCGRARPVASQRSGKKRASAPRWQGPAGRRGIATGIRPAVRAGRSSMKGYGVALLAHKNRRDLHVVGMVWMCFCQQREKD